MKTELKSSNTNLESWGVQMLQDEMEGFLFCIIHRIVGSVGELQLVQEETLWVNCNWSMSDGDGLEVVQALDSNNLMTTL